MRILIHYILPLLLPTLVYFGWAWIASGRKKEEPEEGDPHAGASPPWFWLIVSGFAILVAFLGLTYTYQGGDPDSKYIPPRFENGEIIPGHFE